jgi:hypothetical protein
MRKFHAGSAEKFPGKIREFFFEQGLVELNADSGREGRECWNF